MARAWEESSDDLGLSPGFIDDEASSEFNALSETPIRFSPLTNSRNSSAAHGQRSGLLSPEASTAAGRSRDSLPPPYTPGCHGGRNFSRGSGPMVSDFKSSLSGYSDTSYAHGYSRYSFPIMAAAPIHGGHPSYEVGTNDSLVSQCYEYRPVEASRNVDDAPESVTITFPPALGAAGYLVDPISNFDRLPRKSPLPISRANATARKKQLEPRFSRRLERSHRTVDCLPKEATNLENDGSGTAAQVPLTTGDPRIESPPVPYSNRPANKQGAEKRNPRMESPPAPYLNRPADRQGVEKLLPPMESPPAPYSNRPANRQGAEKRRLPGARASLPSSSGRVSSCAKKRRVAGTSPPPLSNSDSPMDNDMNNASGSEEQLNTYATNDQEVSPSSSSPSMEVTINPSAHPQEGCGPQDVAHRTAKVSGGRKQNAQTEGKPGEGRRSQSHHTKKGTSTVNTSGVTTSLHPGVPGEHPRRSLRRPRSVDSLVTPRPIIHGLVGDASLTEVSLSDHVCPNEGVVQEEEESCSNEIQALSPCHATTSGDSGATAGAARTAVWDAEIDASPSAVPEPRRRKQQSFGCQAEVESNVAILPSKNRRKNRKNRIGHASREDKIQLQRTSVHPKSTEVLNALEDVDAGVRIRPRRHLIPPLDWWVGEHASYARKDGDVLPSLQAVYRAEAVKRRPKSIPQKIKKPDCSAECRPQSEETGLASASESEQACRAVVEYNGRRGCFRVVLPEADLEWAEVDQGDNKIFEVALAFENHQCTTCEVQIPPATEKGLDQTEGTRFAGCVIEGELLECQIGLSSEGRYVLGVGDWIIIPPHTQYNLKNLSTSHWARLVLTLLQPRAAD